MSRNLTPEQERRIEAAIFGQPHEPQQGETPMSKELTAHIRDCQNIRTWLGLVNRPLECAQSRIAAALNRHRAPLIETPLLSLTDISQAVNHAKVYIDLAIDLVIGLEGVAREMRKDTATAESSRVHEKWAEAVKAKRWVSAVAQSTSKKRLICLFCERSFTILDATKEGDTCPTCEVGTIENYGNVILAGDESATPESTVAKSPDTNDTTPDRWRRLWCSDCEWEVKPPHAYRIGQPCPNCGIHRLRDYDLDGIPF